MFGVDGFDLIFVAVVVFCLLVGSVSIWLPRAGQQHSAALEPSYRTEVQ